MNVSLTPELERLVEEQVHSGRYKSASEVVREGLRLLADRDEERRIRLEVLRAEIQKGIDSLNAGLGIPGDQAFRQIYADLEAARP